MSTAERSCKDLERIADLVRQDHPSLSTLWLEPEEKFQTRAMSFDAVNGEVIECLARRFRGRAAEEFPMLYYGFGKARVGSTPLTNLFGVAGLPAYYQPVKAIARQAVVGAEPSPWAVPPADAHPEIFSKETIGPYFLYECLFMPPQLLIEAGFPPSKLHLIMLDREPASSLASWLGKLSHLVPAETLVQYYVITALNIPRIESYARRAGVPVSHYVYEASKEPVRSAQALFKRLGLSGRFTEAAVTDWKEMGQLESDHARVIYPDQPAIYTVPGLHGSDTAYRYHGRAPALTDAQMGVLARSGVQEVYRQAVKACVSDLGFDPATAENLFGREFDRMSVAA